ncbi:glycoside hydrolase family 3 protein [Plicaturopsis crispa FD-325 SS-3]|uniref:Glycoside hydrolase family 3 protein n=1 Tax=Plicaturopsis crispa FD-325 SS-3 TaxID=944288 RepID=A0A0C9SKJ7_PLICR|nr:glycoside hydrolase family 3 protein [Plicaturopsis crispa FD-325 SS-3]
MSTQLTDEIKRNIGQHFVFGFHGHVVSDDVKTLIRDYHVGSIILMKRNVQSFHQVRNLVCDLQQIAKDAGHTRPLLIGIDQENGLVSAFSSTATYEAGTQFPGAMALAATGSVDLAEKIAIATGRELRLAGVNWAYSPVADVNSDPRNPVIGVRSFGDNPEDVGKFVVAVSRGLTSTGIAPSPKHFPGHGDTHVDSHLALPCIDKSKDLLVATELVPFQAAIDDHVASIMTGHMALPQLVGDETPSSLSFAITTVLLRDELGFRDSVIVTDCLEMEAVAEKYGSERSAVMSFQAGADIAMICHTMSRHRGSVELTYEAVASGELSLDTLRASEARISALKDRFVGSWEEVLSRGIDDAQLALLREQNAALSAQAYSSAIALVGDPVSFRPLSTTTNVLVFTPVMESLNRAVDDAEGVLREAGRVRNTAGPSYLAFADSVARRALREHIVYSSATTVTAELKLSIESASAVIFTTRNADRSTWQIDFLRAVLGALPPSTPRVLLASCAPYDFLNAPDIDSPYLVSFEFTAPALEAAAAVIFGEVQAKGIVPVKLEGKSAHR